MASTIELGDMVVEVVRKEIKHVHLSVHPPSGAVRIAAPQRMTPETIRAFAIAKLGWIRRQQAKLRAQEREAPREFLERESHYVWGRRYLLAIVEAHAAPGIELEPRRLVLRMRPGATVETRAAVLAEWYRRQVKEAALPLIARWELRMGVRVGRLYVRHMKTKWGSCNPAARAIRLNTELAKKPPECLEYILVHEMVHLLEPTHNERFVALMDRWLPSWRERRAVLNRLPVRHEEWGY